LNKKIIIYIIPFVLGSISSFSLPPYNLVFLNFITFPLLFLFFLKNYNLGKFIAFSIGWIFGFGYFIFSLHWITNSLTFDESYKKLIPFSLILIPFFLGTFYGLFTLFLSWFKLKLNIYSILLFAVIFSAIEFIRGLIFGGFPWNLIAYSWTNYIDNLQILSFIGTYSFNLLSITLFLAPLIWFMSMNKPKKIIFTLGFVSLTLINYFYGTYTLQNFNKKKLEKLEVNIKIISPKIEIKRYFEQDSIDLIAKELIKLSNPNKSKKTIFIYPEGTFTGLYLDDLNYLHDIFKNNFSKNHKLVLGITSLEGKKIFNSMVVLNNNFELLGKYNKNKLVPFGEFLPFENLFKKAGIKKITHGYNSFSPDIKRDLLKISDLKFLPLICYEIIYSGRLNKQKVNFDFILNISEDGWFGKKIGPEQHFSHSVFRAIEEGKNIIRSSNNGISAFINPKGEVIKKIESTQKGVIVINSLSYAETTIFSKHGNKIFFYFLIFYITLIFFLKKNERFLK